MDNAASIYILPALLALMVKLFLLFFARNGRSRSSIVFTLLLLFACHNLTEVLAYIEYFKGDYSMHVLRWYYVMTLCGGAATLVYAFQISNLLSSFRGVSLAAVALSICLSLFILLTDSVVSGATSIGYALTAEQGPQYWLFQLLFLGMLFLISGVLIRGYLTTKDHVTEIQCGYTLLGLLPIVIVAISVVALMTFGMQLNAAGIIPVCTTFFVLIIIKGELTHKLTDVRRHIPFSLERRTSGEIMDIFSRYAQDEVNYRDGMAELEKLLVVHKHSKNRGNVTRTAASMAIPRSSLYSIFRRLGIEVKDMS
ncbi:MAG: hypothetical protein ACI9WC_002687 [Arenicella sp.]|jgi:hypothetical protein